MKIAVMTNRMNVDPFKTSKRWPMRKGRRKVPGMVTTYMSLRVLVLLCSSRQGFFQDPEGKSKDDKID